MVCCQKKLKNDLQLAKDLGQFSICIEQKKLHDRLDRCDKKRYSAKRKKLREELLIGEKVLVLAERIKKKAAQASFISNMSRTYLHIYNKKNSTDKCCKILLAKRPKSTENLQKDFKELNYL